MARKRGGGGGGDEGGNWMDTYGDLVTLLLTFFVLLYSMSSLDQSKWKIFVQSIYPNRAEEEVDQVSIDEVDPNELSPTNMSGTLGDPAVPEQAADVDVNELYLMLARAYNENGVNGVEVQRGQDYTFIVFRDKAFFDGDSSVLTQMGKDTLDIFCATVASFNDQISQVNIMGHTAQGDPNKPNTIRTDRMLSVDRAAEVCIYIQEKNVLDPDKLVNIGYGQFRPLESNDTAEGRAANRRVEILMIDKDAQARTMDEYYNDIMSGANKDKTITTGEDDGSGTAAEGASADAAAGAAGTAPAESGTGTAGSSSGAGAGSTAAAGDEYFNMDEDAKATGADSEALSGLEKEAVSSTMAGHDLDQLTGEDSEGSGEGSGGGSTE